MAMNQKQEKSNKFLTIKFFTCDLILKRINVDKNNDKWYNQSNMFCFLGFEKLPKQYLVHLECQDILDDISKRLYKKYA